jgi:predicted TIM-barrel fold metal-dependent hydrolase
MNEPGNDCLPPEKKVDIHTHIIGTGDSGSGCRLSKELASGPVFSSILGSLNISPFGACDRLIRELLLDAVNKSERIERFVLLSMDGVYKNSRLAEAETHLLTPNDYVARMACENERALFGASVHPYRDKREMLNEVERCLDMGAVLFSWAPCIQQIDPEDERCIPFYLRLAREGAPLHCHTGAEFVTPPMDGKTVKNGSPKKMTRALDIGVKVIAAFCGLPSAPGAGSAHFDELIEMLTISEERKWDFYVDASCLFTAEGLFYHESLMKEIDCGHIGADRIVYGSDFPAPLAAREALVPVGEERSACYERCNLLDERYNMARNLGIPESAFTNAWRVLRPSVR